MKNLEAIADVRSGKSTVANAAWWGFDAEDATEALQSAIDSGVKRVVVPNMHADWIIQPIKLAGNQELIFERGTVVTAKRGEYRGRGDSMFSAQDVKGRISPSVATAQPFVCGNRIISTGLYLSSLAGTAGMDNIQRRSGA